MRQKYRIYIYTILMIIPLLILFYISLYLFIYFNSDNFFLEDKVSKSINLKYRASQIDKLDYIFIGSSKTQNHISTNKFKQNGIEIYNYGRPGMFLKDFSFAVNEAVKYYPKYIVLSLDISEIIGEQNIIKKLKFPTQFDYNFINSIEKENTLKFISIQDRISNEIRLKHLLFQFNQFIKNRFLVKKRLLYYDLEINNIDCNISYFRGTMKRTVFLCSNGDGFIVTNKFNGIKNSIIKWDTYKIDNINFKLLNKLIDFIKSHNIRPIIIFQPRGYGIDYQYNNQIFQKINTKNIIDLTNKYNKDIELWADKYHFNYLGREKYSIMLLKLLNKNPNKNR